MKNGLKINDWLGQGVDLRCPPPQHGVRRDQDLHQGEGCNTSYSYPTSKICQVGIVRIDIYY